jgi:hypothetical protein
MKSHTTTTDAAAGGLLARPPFCSCCGGRGTFAAVNLIGLHLGLAQLSLKVPDPSVEDLLSMIDE